MTAVPTVSTVSFSDLNLLPPIQNAVRNEGYTHPTPIQAAAIPKILTGQDLLGCAQTGTGKTAAFALPILQLLASRPASGQAVRALILTPTRELATQIGDSFSNYGRELRLRNAVIFGGVGQKPQEAVLRRGVDILVATPGRLLDLMNQRLVHFNQLEIFVLDEADRMLDMGFIHDVRRVIATLPKKRQTLFFSATMPGEIAKLASQILHNPLKVEVTPVASTAEKIAQAVFHVEGKLKTSLLIHLLGDPSAQRVLVFTRTKHDANRVAESLVDAGIGAAAIHGNKSQSAREKALEGIKSGENRVLVATDIAARGIDIDQVTHVYNYDIPNVPETYVHRIGRTARAGKSGVAVSFCSSNEKPFLADVERLTRKRLTVIGTPEGLQPEVRKRRGPRPPRRGGGRPKHGGGGGHGGQRHGGGGGHGRGHGGGHSQRR